MKLITGIFLSLLAQIIVFVQLQGGLKYDWIRNHKFAMSLLGIVVSYLYMYSVQYLVPAFDGQTWPSRVIGFGIGIVVFTVMSYTMFGETVNLKTGICLSLATIILIIQIFWK